jgi:hypothetical protein
MMSTCETLLGQPTNWTPEKADQLITATQTICDNEADGALHLAGCIAALIPDKETALGLLHVIFDAADNDEEGDE